MSACRAQHSLVGALSIAQQPRESPQVGHPRANVVNAEGTAYLLKVEQIYPPVLETTICHFPFFFFFFLIKCCHSFQPLTPNGRSRAFPSPSLELGTWNKAINSRTHPSSPSNALQRHFIALPLCVEKRHPPSLSKTLNILKIAIPVLQKHTGASSHGDLCR